MAEAPVSEAPAPRKPGRPEPAPVADKSAGAGPRGLSNEERDARARALAAARQRNDVERVEELDRAERAAVAAAAAPPPPAPIAAARAPSEAQAPVRAPEAREPVFGTPTYRRHRSASAHIVQSGAAAARRRQAARDRYPDPAARQARWGNAQAGQPRPSGQRGRRQPRRPQGGSQAGHAHADRQARREA